MNHHDDVLVRLQRRTGRPILGFPHRRASRFRLIAGCGFGLAVTTAFFGCGRNAEKTPPPATAATPTTASTTSTAATVSVSMNDLKFSPATIEVKAGGTVQWTNDDMVPHTATSSSFDSGPLSPGQSWRYTFLRAGTYPYVCKFHPRMIGTVVVK